MSCCKFHIGNRQLGLAAVMQELPVYPGLYLDGILCHSF